MAGEAKRLVQVGYFPKELPCEFTSRTLAEKYNTIRLALRVNKLAQAEAEVFSLARGGHGRTKAIVGTITNLLDWAGLLEFRLPDEFKDRKVKEDPPGAWIAPGPREARPC